LVGLRDQVQSLSVRHILFGTTYHCTQCDFEFCSGWSHHAGGQFFVCKHCRADFVLGGGQSAWGPRPNEQLEFFLIGADGQLSTGRHVTVERQSQEQNTVGQSVLVLDIDAVPCPHCQREGMLAQFFEPGETCPQCRTGIIERQGTCIY
jgi:hypothetical protein